MRTTLFLMALLLLAPLAQAQGDSYIGCAADGSDCTTTSYGLGNSGPAPPFAPGSLEVLFVGPGDGSCGLSTS